MLSLDIKPDITIEQIEQPKYLWPYADIRGGIIARTLKQRQRGHPI
jgi:hypothetical protein